MEKGCLWPPEEELPTFRPAMETFAQRTHSIALLLLSSLAVSLGYPKNYFDSLHDATAEDCQATLRLLHYPAVDATVVEDKEYFRAGPHTEYGIYCAANHNNYSLCLPAGIALLCSINAKEKTVSKWPLTTPALGPQCSPSTA